jgi:hypothetical protein
MRSREIRFIAVFCIAVTFLSLVMVPAAAASGTVQHESVDVVVNRATISISVSPEPRNPILNHPAGYPTGDAGTGYRQEPANGTMEIMIPGTITIAGQNTTGMPATRRPGQLVNVTYTVINPPATGDSSVGEPGNTSGSSGLTGSNDTGTPARLPVDLLSQILKKLNEEKNALTCIFTGC